LTLVQIQTILKIVVCFRDGKENHSLHCCLCLKIYISRSIDYDVNQKRTDWQIEQKNQQVQNIIA